MEKSVMKKWVKALRSGEYLQCTGSLTEKDEQGNDTFCCLGVLTNLYVQENGISKLKLDNSKGNGLSFWDFNEEFDSYLCDPIRKWAGMRSNKGDLFLSGLDPLYEQNDDGKSFSEIADIIEEKYEEL